MLIITATVAGFTGGVVGSTLVQAAQGEVTSAVEWAIRFALAAIGVIATWFCYELA